MATWIVRAGARSVSVESSNWLGALGLALPSLGLSAGALGRLVCSVRPEGGAEAFDPVAGVRVLVSPAVPQAPPPALDMPSASFAPSLAPFEDDTIETGEDEEPPAPSPATPARMEAVFDRCAEIAAAADGPTACDTALRVLASFVPADAGAVLVRTRGGNHLRFAAASGPSAQKLVGTYIPVDQGIAGFAHGFEMSVIVDDARRDSRHYRKVDRDTGYRTEAVLAVPIKAPTGASMGCLELLNPPVAFDASDLEVAEAVGAALGAWLAGVGA
ncbi:MAG: GAF domain-containing protein [Myxococcota bacterium]